MGSVVSELKSVVVGSQEAAAGRRKRDKGEDRSFDALAAELVAKVGGDGVFSWVLGVFCLV
jgi:hypothetical protein